MPMTMSGQGAASESLAGDVKTRKGNAGLRRIDIVIRLPAQLLDLVLPAQHLGERQHLRVIAPAFPEQQPDARRGFGRCVGDGGH